MKETKVAPGALAPVLPRVLEGGGSKFEGQSGEGEAPFLESFSERVPCLRLGGVVLAIFCYSLASSTMILFNKACMQALPAPCVVSFLQVAATTLLILLAWSMGLVRLHAVGRGVLQQYGVYSVIFVLGMNFSMRVLAVTNVETLLVFRSCSPIIVSVIDTAALGRALPSARSTLALISIALGAVWFMVCESQFSVQGLRGMTHVIINTLLIAMLMTYGKWITDGSQISLSMSVLLSNATSAIPILILGFIEGEGSTVWGFIPTLESVVALGTSCIIGTAISYSGWQCRILMSATSYTLVGVLNKILTMALNLIVWDDHANWLSVCGLIVCLLGGSFYEQAPKAVKPPPKDGEGGGGGELKRLQDGGEE